LLSAVKTREEKRRMAEVEAVDTVCACLEYEKKIKEI
jgi:hypothetical protein